MQRHSDCNCPTPLPPNLCLATCERRPYPNDLNTHPERVAGVDGEIAGGMEATVAGPTIRSGAEARQTARCGSCEVSGPASKSQDSAGGLASPAGGMPATPYAHGSPGCIRTRKPCGNSPSRSGNPSGGWAFLSRPTAMRRAEWVRGCGRG